MKIDQFKALCKLLGNNVVDGEEWKSLKYIHTPGEASPAADVQLLLKQDKITFAEEPAGFVITEPPASDIMMYINDDTAVHTFIEDKNDLPRLQKSKYLQSNTGDSFKKAKEFLNCGKKVIFAGTPCQIAGLKNYLGMDYDNLLCIDIVCHGVPSQKMFDKYISELEKELGSKVTGFTFRNKVNFIINHFH